MKLLSVDPGKHNGWATWDFWEGGTSSPELLKMGVTKDLEGFYDLLNSDLWAEIHWLVYEDYKIYPRSLKGGWGQEWTGGVALHAIGAMELFARKHAIQIKSQPSSILPVGCGYIGFDYRKGVHVPNNISAIAHGAYWLVKNKHANPREFNLAS